MGIKNYIVREGFVVALATKREDGSVSEKTFEGGDTLKLDDETAKDHLHKLELADAKDRAAAAAAEAEANEAKAAKSGVVDAASVAQMIGNAIAAAIATAKPAEPVKP